METSPTDNELDQALDYVRRLLVDGLRHGFFELTVTCEIVRDRKRRLLVKAGKSEQFTFPVDDLNERRNGDCCDGSASGLSKSDLATGVTQAEAPDTDRVRGSYGCGVTHGGRDTAAKRPGA